MTERLFLRLDEDPVEGPEVGAPPGAFRAFSVPGPLKEYVSHILSYREVFPDGDGVIERVLPDGAVRLAFNLGDPPSVGGAKSEAAEAVGSCRRPVLVGLSGCVVGLSLTLRPGAASAVLGIPLGELRDTAISLDEIWRGEGTRLLERMAGQPTDTARAKLLCAELERRLSRTNAAVHAPVAHAMARIHRSQGSCRLSDLTDSLGISERRLQQLFRAHVGFPPCTYLRLARLHHCLRLLRERPSPAWAGLAVDSGYYDQAHLINEFQVLIGLSPAVFLRRTASDSSNPAAC